MPPPPNARPNSLLKQLPLAESAALSPHLELVALPQGLLMHDAGAIQRHLWFPINCIVSLQYLFDEGCADELALIGQEGVVGLAAVTRSSSPHRAVVRRPGFAWRCSADGLVARLVAPLVLQQRLLRYSQFLMAQVAQIAVCTRHHSLSQQLCRWLLMTLDRLPDNELCMTHEQIAQLLGVRREGITVAAGRLQRAGIIHYSRGRMQILDRHRLQASGCECYGVISRELARLFPPSPQATATTYVPAYPERVTTLLNSA